MKKSLFHTSLIVALILAIVGLTATTYAFWDQLTHTEENTTITVGEGATITVEATAEVEEGKFLVPQGVKLGENDVNEVKLVYTVKLDKKFEGEGLGLTVEASNIKVDGIDTYSTLVNIDIAHALTINLGQDVTVDVTVTLNMPENEIEYDAVAGKLITFDLTFTAN